jgi:hypothetical protein
MNSRNNTVIVGLPKTGTTGLYQSVKRAMLRKKIETVCLFEPKGLKPMESYFESELAVSGASMLSKIMFKPVFYRSNILDSFDKKIMIVRDPRDRLLSMFLFKALSRPKQVKELIPGFISLLEKKEADPKSISFVDMMLSVVEMGFGAFNLEGAAEQLVAQTEFAEKQGLYVIHYEDFVSGNFDGISEYLGVEVDKNEKQSSWLKHIERSRGYGEWKNWFVQSDVDALSPIFKKPMINLGYDDDWSLLAEQTIDPTTSSLHVKTNFESRLHQAMSNADAELTLERLELVKTRAEDGRLADVFDLAKFYRDGSAWNEIDKSKAKYWFEVSAAFGEDLAKAELLKL